MAENEIELDGTTPIAAVDALKKVGYNVTVQGEVSEGDTLLDVFPELNQMVPEEGGEPKDVDPKKPKEKSIKLPNDKLPRETKESKNPIPKQKNVSEKIKGKIMTKKEVLEVITGGGGQPATRPSPGTAPTTTPTIAPTKPGQKPERKNPFKPKHKPNPKAALPDFLSSEALHIGECNDTNKKLKK